jgi:hypothetical protein
MCIVVEEPPLEVLFAVAPEVDDHTRFVEQHMCAWRLHCAHLRHQERQLLDVVLH